jgi:glycosyltransferase involved in cell wall biosynthesis
VPAVLDSRPYLLAVGTIEPRKNHMTLLSAYDTLRARHPELHLVVVGREGWNAEAVTDRLRRHASTDDHVHWFHSASDAELAVLYRHALLVVIPTMAEGFGLPVAEALAYGAVVVAGDSPAIREVGGDAAEYVSPTDVDGWVAAIARHLDDPDHHAARRVASARFVARPWAVAAGELGDQLLAVGRSSA